MLRKIVKFILLTFFGFIVSFITEAQTRISSPYTFYGVGELQNNRFARNMAMGGLAFGLRDSKTINMMNPASYSSFDTSHFLCEIAAVGNISTLKSNVQTQSPSSLINLGYLIFGTPITKWLSASIGIKPFSETGYRVTMSQDVINTGTVSSIYTGKGGIDQVYIGFAAKFLKHFSVGFNMSYLFGTTHNDRSIVFPNTYTFNTKVQNSYTVSDIFFNYGLQYFTKFKSKYLFCAGAAFTLPSLIKAEQDYLATRYVTTAGVDNDIDTIKYLYKEKGNISFPLLIGLGITFQNPQKWIVGADFSWGNWKKFKKFGVSDSLNDVITFAIGGEITPKYNAPRNYLNRMTYRLGFRYNDTYLGLHQYNLKEFGVSFGFGFPISKIKSSINFGVEFGKMGTTQYNLVQNNFIRFAFGIAIKEEWFFKRKLE